MAILKPFKGFRPLKKYAKQIASRPYDVLSSEEARIEAKGNPYSFLHVIKPEIDLPEATDHYSPEVYNKGKENLERMIRNGILVQDGEENLYVYAQTMRGRTQYGLVGCAGVSDYLNNIIRKHELTRPDKEEDRKKHIRITGFNAEPVFFAYPDNDEIDEMIKRVVENEPEYDFTSDDGIGHHFWVIRERQTISRIVEIFNSDIPFTYVADGHHRTAAAALVGDEKKRSNPGHSGQEEYNYFLAVHFPANQLRIIDYNRVVRDLNGLSSSEFLGKIAKSFEIIDKGSQVYKPAVKSNFSMYFEGIWYSLSAKPETLNSSDPVARLDVTLLSRQILEPVLNIMDLRNSKRIDFVGGIRGLEELKKRVDSGEMKAAFALFPVTMDELMEIADTGNIMPPKTTWFEPKLRSGLVLHQI
jgi:uncharacterized protein (DUF1015 family)